MQPDTPNFDSVAHAYRWMEYASFGPMLERCRFRFLSRCADARHALVLGDGDGRFTARLLVENPNVQVDTVDASPAMLAILRERAVRGCGGAEARLYRTEADIRQFTPTGKDYDLVVTQFFLDCLTDAEVLDLVERVLPHLTDDAIWLVSEFSIPENGWRRFGARAVVRSLYFAFSVLTGLRVRRIPNYAKIFLDNQVRLSENAAYLGGMLVSEVWERRPA
jgi:ubiquinone/menaquinone biosynthesis C-methylase UbiE